MNYRNRGQRCPHGMLIGVIDCPGCGEAKPKRQAGGSYYVRSMGGHVVINRRPNGRKRECRARGYARDARRTG